MTKILYVNLDNGDGLVKKLKEQGFEIEKKRIKIPYSEDNIANLQEANDLFRIRYSDSIKNYKVLIIQSGILLDTQIDNLLENNPNTALVVVHPYPNYRIQKGRNYLFCSDNSKQLIPFLQRRLEK